MLFTARDNIKNARKIKTGIIVGSHCAILCKGTIFSNFIENQKGMRKVLFTICAVAIVALFTSSCGKSSDSSGSYAVTIAGMAFTPVTLTVTAGSTVTWTNNDNVVHNVTSTGGTFVSSGPISPGGTYLLQFNTKGSFPYSCTIHPTMTGVIIVQ